MQFDFLSRLLKPLRRPVPVAALRVGDVDVPLEFVRHPKARRYILRLTPEREQAEHRAEQHGHDMQTNLVEQSGPQALVCDIRARHRDDRGRRWQRHRAVGKQDRSHHHDPAARKPCHCQ